MDYLLEMEAAQRCKRGMKICGDVILKTKDPGSGRYICVLSDGLGSGVKANVLATLTARMAQQYVLNDFDLTRSARIIMNTLPVCRERKISYATFSLFDVDPSGRARIVEYDSPSFFFLRRGRVVVPEKTRLDLSRSKAFKEEYLLYSEINMQAGDRLVFCSDGVTQAGLGSPAHPLGWREKPAAAYLEDLLGRSPGLSARALSRRFAEQALLVDGGRPKDDITALTVFMREPRRLLIATGPPMDGGRDKALAERVKSFSGRIIACGGTTANILSREWQRPLSINIRERSEGIPPTSTLEGADLVTEGMLTLNRAAEMLEKGQDDPSPSQIKDGADRFVQLVRDSDRIHFLVGTRINEAHQDPSVPVEIGIRRTMVSRICRVLEEHYLKETSVEYI